MKILAIEFSSSQPSVALGEGSVAGFEVRCQRTTTPSQEAASQGPRGAWISTQVFGLIDQALTEVDWKRRQIDCLAVGLGPGSYTGIRIAIAIAQGWQLAWSVRLLGLSSVEALAWDAFRAGERGRCHMVVDAQRREFYVATYDLTDEGPIVREALRLEGIDWVTSQLADGALLVGPDMGRRLEAGRSLYPSAASVASLASERSDGVVGEELEPIYLRAVEFVKAPAPRWVVEDS